MAKILRKLIIAQISIAFICLSCNEVGTSARMDCVRGKLIGNYCEGVVIEILDGNDIGMDWIGMFDSKPYKNSVVASIDTLLTKNLSNSSSLFPNDSIFYFEYKQGEYPEKAI